MKYIFYVSMAESLSEALAFGVVAPLLNGELCRKGREVGRFSLNRNRKGKLAPDYACYQDGYWEFHSILY